MATKRVDTARDGQQTIPVAGRPGGTASAWQTPLGRAATTSLQFLLVAAAVSLVCWLAVKVKIVTLPLLIALILAAALRPVVQWTRRIGMGRVTSALATLLASIVALTLLIVGIVMTVINEWPALAAQAGKGIQQLLDLLASYGIPIDDSHLEQYLNATLDYLQHSGAGQSAVAGVAVVTELVAGSLLTLVILFFFLLDGQNMWNFVLGFVPGRGVSRVDEAGHESMTVLGHYIRGTVTIAAFAAGVDLIVMLILQLPLAFPLAAMIFLGAFVPIIGALLTGLAAALVALVVSGPPGALILVIAVIVVNQIEHHVLQPKVMGSALSLHGVVVIVALAIGADQGGVAGALLAVPLTAIVWATVKVFRNHAHPGGGSSTVRPEADADEAATYETEAESESDASVKETGLPKERA